MRTRIATLALAAAGLATAVIATPSALAVEGLWKREISFQSKQDLFYNLYEGPDPSGTTAGMYPSPRPVPPHVGWTYTTYQPFMPHEYQYHHKRSHYAHVPGAGWSRAKIRYKTYGLRLDHMLYNLSDCY